MQDPTESPLLEGRWRLLFTTRPGSASPIQKTFVGVESFTVYQEVLLTSAEEARVNNIVDFGAKIGTLKVPLPLQKHRVAHACIQPTVLSLAVLVSYSCSSKMYGCLGKGLVTYIRPVTLSQALEAGKTAPGLRLDCVILVSCWRTMPPTERGTWMQKHIT